MSMATILSVTELTRYVRDILESRLGEVWVEGEISNYRKQSSGHHYFTLKDDRAQLACVMFARAYSARSGRMTKATPKAAKVLNMASTGSPDGK